MQLGNYFLISKQILVMRSENLVKSDLLSIIKVDPKIGLEYAEQNELLKSENEMLKNEVLACRQQKSNIYNSLLSCKMELNQTKDLLKSKTELNKTLGACNTNYENAYTILQNENKILEGRLNNSKIFSGVFLAAAIIQAIVYTLILGK